MNDTTDAAGIFAPLWKRKWADSCRGPAGGRGNLRLLQGPARRLRRLDPAVPRQRHRTAERCSAQQQLGEATLQRPLARRPGRHHQLDPSSPSRCARGCTTKATSRRAKGKVKAEAAGTSDFITITTEASTARGPQRHSPTATRKPTSCDSTPTTSGRSTPRSRTRAPQLRRIETRDAPRKGKHASAGSHRHDPGGNLSSKLNQLESQLSAAQRPAGRAGESEPAAALAASRKRTRSSASCSASRWPASPSSSSAAPIVANATWPPSNRASRHRC